MLIQIHMLQNYSPSNLNRDDTGSPKDAVFGGTRRGRISSQCLKRSIRKSETFVSEFTGEGLLGVRTKKLRDLLQEQLAALGADDQMARDILDRIAKVGRESTKRSKEKETEPADASGEERAPEVETKQLIFIGRDELPRLAQKLVEHYKRLGPKKWNDPKLEMADITKGLGASTPFSVDIAMFGRMTTSEVFEDVYAAVQVAHPLSTNALAQEFDYYTAVDDLSDDPGAGMIGDIEFNSCTYYKYLSVHWEKLVKNLAGDARVAQRAVLALIEAAATAQPSGKQNTFAANCLPDVVLIEVRAKNLAVSYVNAFLKPARSTHDTSLMDDSVGKLSDYMTRVAKMYNLDDTRAYAALQDYSFPNAQVCGSLAELKAWLGAQLEV